MRARGCGRLRPVSTSRGSGTLLEGRIMCTDTVVHTWSALVVLAGLSAGCGPPCLQSCWQQRPRPDPAPAKHFGTRTGDASGIRETLAFYGITRQATWTHCRLSPPLLWLCECMRECFLEKWPAFWKSGSAGWPILLFSAPSCSS